MEEIRWINGENTLAKWRKYAGEMEIISCEMEAIGW